MEKSDLKISYININDLKPSEYNPRKWNEKSIKDLKNSIQEFGLIDPIIVNCAPERKGIIIGGHFRFHIAKELGYTQVPVIYLNVPDLKKERKLNIRLNKNLGEWDFDLLANFDEDILLEAGFESIELDNIFGLDEPNEKDNDVPEVPVEPKSKLGDIYQLGNHRIMCGDSTKIEDVEKLMNGKKADCVITDPPYNTGMIGKPNNEKARLSHIFNDKIENWEIFLKDIFSNYYINTKENCVFYVFIDWRRVGDIRLEIEKLMDVKNVIVWDKKVHGLGSDYKSTYELCVVGKKGNPKINNRYELEYQDIWRLQRDMGRNENHATAKPVELLEKPIRHASNKNDIILDLFLGSGSTLIACEKTGRVCMGMEISPAYIDVIIKRFEDYTNKKAVKVV